NRDPVKWTQSCFRKRHRGNEAVSTQPARSSRYCCVDQNWSRQPRPSDAARRQTNRVRPVSQRRTNRSASTLKLGGVAFSRYTREGALIRKGSGTVLGVAELTGTLPKLTCAALIANVTKHRVPANETTPEFKWTTAWVLENARPLRKPIPYHHRPGAVIW